MNHNIASASWRGRSGREPTLRLAERLGYAARTLHRPKRNGVPASKADSAAIRIASHPAYIWPDHWHTTP